MEREQILNVVIENIKLNVDGLEEEEIDPTKSLADYGASSLDIVEIVSSSMRELRIRVPRAALVDLKNIDELVTLFASKVKK